MRINYLLTASVIFLLSSCFRNTPKNETDNNSSILKPNSFQKSNFKLNTVDDLYQFLTYSDDRYPLVSAHRGGNSSGYPENAIETFNHVSNIAPMIIECDIRMSKDSVLFLMHDETVNRTSNGEGKVNDLTYKELKSLKLKDNDGKQTNFKIPTLTEALQWGKGKVVFTLDVKQDVPYQLLSKELIKNDALPYSVIITYNARQARAMYQINPDAMLSVSVKSENDLRKLAEANIPDNRVIAFVGTSLPKPDLIQRLHAHGIKTILGTLGNLDKQAEARGYQVYADFIESGADVISTDRPKEAQKALDFYIKKRNITSPFINN